VSGRFGVGVSNQVEIVNARWRGLVPVITSWSIGARSGQAATEADPAQVHIVGLPEGAHRVPAQHWPLGVAENDDCDFAALQVLLIPHVPVRRHQKFEACRFCRVQQFAVYKSVPAGILRFRDGVALKKRDQRRGRSVIKENTHQPSDRAVAYSSPHPNCAPRIPAPLPPVPASRRTTP